MFPRFLASATIPQVEAIAKRKPAKHARKLPLVNHPLDAAPGNVIRVGPGSVGVDTVPGIREAAAVEGRVE